MVREPLISGWSSLYFKQTGWPLLPVVSSNAAYCILSTADIYGSNLKATTLINWWCYSVTKYTLHRMLVDLIQTDLYQM